MKTLNSELQPIHFNTIHPCVLAQMPSHLRTIIHERDNFTCRYCGLESRKYQQIVFHGHHWWNLQEVFTACIFCQQYFSLDSVPLMRSGVLVVFPTWLPAELNRLATEIYVARINQEAAPKARACLDYVMTTRQEARQSLGYDQPEKLAEELKLSKTQETSGILEKLHGIRLFPLDRRIHQEEELEFNQFPLILAHWRSPDGPFARERMTFERIHRFYEEFVKPRPEPESTAS